MSITDELREFMAGADGYELWCPRHKNELTAIADRIDAEHERELRETGEDIVRDVRREWVRLPLDADGVPIHVGDVMDFLGRMTVDATDGHNVFFFADNWTDGVYCVRADDLRHYQPPTVEDVLREFTDEVWNRCCEGATASDSGIDELVAEYAAKLRLANDGEDSNGSGNLQVRVPKASGDAHNQ